VRLDGQLAGPASHVAAPVVLAVAAAGDVHQQGHVTAATTHRPAAAGAVVSESTFPEPHTTASGVSSTQKVGSILGPTKSGKSKWKTEET